MILILFRHAATFLQRVNAAVGDMSGNLNPWALLTDLPTFLVQQELLTTVQPQEVSSTQWNIHLLTHSFVQRRQPLSYQASLCESDLSFASVPVFM